MSAKVDELTRMINGLNAEELDLIIEYIYTLKDLENIKARLDVESGNTETFDSVEEWWQSINED
ncbi:MAG TPA: hypothetical protein IAA34_09425 [Candidatus Enterococcus stercoripullorum]|nr:hypothetical protein [Candidatus Enterococcus stercoripullorum]